MKRFLSCALAAMLCLCLLAAPALAADLEAGTGSGYYVVDDANVLSAQTEELLTQYNTVLESLCHNAQLVVATVSYLDEDTEIAATRLLNNWGVGSASDSNGMLLLLVAEEYRGWLAVGAGLSRDFDDDTAEEYLDEYFWDDVDAERYDDAVQTLAGHIYDWYLDYYGVQQTAAEPSGGYDNSYGYDPYYGTNSYSSGGGSSIMGMIFVIIIVVLLLWVLGASSRYSRMRRRGYTGGFFPIFWFGGRRRYRSWWQQPPPPPGPGPGPGGPAGFGGPGGFMGGGYRAAPPRRSSFSSNSRPPRSGGGFRGGGGGGFHGGGFGGHSGGGGGGRH